jgi:hypothetical protein
MDSDYFTEGYAEKKELVEIEERLASLKDELTQSGEYSTGRSETDIKEQIEALERRKEELHLKIEHEEAKNE